MILIVGGLGQGKSAFASQCQKEEISGGRPGRTAAVFNGRKGKPEQAFAAGTVLHLEAVILRLMREGEDAAAWSDRLLCENPGVIVTADEIGCGIVPADPLEREYRETYGRICQRLAAASARVYRVVCGLPQQIK